MIREIITNKKALAIPSKPISDWGETHRIVQDMIDTGEHYRKKPIGCVGLAANQIGELVNIIIVHTGGDWIVMCNPELEVMPGKMGYSHEGCLSRPGVKAKIKRHKKVRVAWLDLFFCEETKQVVQSPKLKKFGGFSARIIQHEMDHLKGVFI